MKASQSHFTSGTNPHAGFSLLELMIACMVMMIGLTGGLAIVLAAVAGNNRDKMDSTSTILSQMTMEMISSVSASSSASVTITDCNPTTSSASHTINTAGAASSGAGAPLTSGGGIDFSQATVTVYSMLFYSCQASTGDRQAIYDVRWNIKTLSNDAKLVTVAAERNGADPTQPIYFALPVSLKMIVGL
jgi:Tfp pilus assembly protein PilV